jgi:hypothetical protein
MNLARMIIAVLCCAAGALFDAACSPNVPDPESEEWVCDTQADCLDDYSCLADSPNSASHHCRKNLSADDSGHGAGD